MAECKCFCGYVCDACRAAVRLQADVAVKETTNADLRNQVENLKADVERLRERLRFHEETGKIAGKALERQEDELDRLRQVMRDTVARIEHWCCYPEAKVVNREGPKDAGPVWEVEVDMEFLYGQAKVLKEAADGSVE
jgi:hypothetical protein